MLSLDKPIGPIHGVMVYADHADPNQHYYMPERPRLARDENGVPEFLFLKYRRDVTDDPSFDPTQKQELGGGFLAFTTDLSVDDTVLAAIKSVVGGGDGQLTPVQCQTGTVRLSITKDAVAAPDAPPTTQPGLTFFEEIYGTSVPSLFGDNRATFAIALGQEAATLMEAAMLSGISPIGVIYDLKFLGMRPAFDVKVTADYERIYDGLDVEFGITASYASIGLKAQIDLAWQKLREDGSIKVEVVKFTDDEALRKQADAAFDWIKSQLLQDFFTPALKPPAWMDGGPATAAPGAAAARPAVAQQGTARPALGTGTTAAPTPAPLVRNLSSGTVSPAAANTAIAAPTVAAPAVPPAAAAPAVGVPAAANPAAANPAAAVGQVLTGAGQALGGATPKTPATGVRAAPPPAAKPQGALPTPGAAASPGFGLQLAFTLKETHLVEKKTREFEFSEQAAVSQEVAPQGLFSTMVGGVDLSRSVKEISLDDDFFKRLTATFTMGADLAAEGVGNVALNVEYPANRPAGVAPTATGGALFSPTASTPYTFNSWLDAAKHLDYQYQLQVEFDATSPWVGKESKVVSPWIVSRARQLAVDPLDVIGLLSVPISIGSLDPVVAQVQVEVAYADTANDFTASTTFVLHPGDPVVTWKLRLSDPTQRSYSYRCTYVFKDNVKYTGAWVTTADSSLVVNDPFTNVMNLRFVPVLDPTNLQEADVAIVYSEADTGYEHRAMVTFAPPTLTSALVTIPTLAAQPTGFSYTTTIVRADGTVNTPTAVNATADDTAVPVHDGDGTTHRINVQLVDTTLGGLLAIKVDLTGPDGDFAEVIFTPAGNASQKVTLVAAVGVPWAYTYTVTGYTAKGLPMKGDARATSEPQLLVRTPTAT